jgi:hypothetical protein
VLELLARFGDGVLPVFDLDAAGAGLPAFDLPGQRSGQRAAQHQRDDDGGGRPGERVDDRGGELQPVHGQAVSVVMVRSRLRVT